MVVRLATRDELDARMPGGLAGNDVDVSRADATLDDVSALVAFEAHRELDEADYATLTDRQKGILRAVTVASARRALLNPEGLTAEGLGPYSQQQSNASPDVYLTANELRQVRRFRPTGSVQSVGFTRGPIETHRWDDQLAPTVSPDGTPGEPIAFSEPPTT